MTQEHPITPLPEIVREWQIRIEYCSKRADREAVVAKIFQLGADMELEACCHLLRLQGFDVVDDLRASRRPKPAGLKEQALKSLKDIGDACESEGFYRANEMDIIRRALEYLPS